MFTQIYTPVASEGWSVLAAVSPLLLLFVLILSRRVSSPVAFSITLVLTAAMAWILWRMPAAMVLATVLYGVLFALFPLFYVIWSALFLFRVAEDGGYIDRIQEGLQAVGDQMEWKILIVGFGLTAFIDSTAGFLAPVAIATALLSKIGVDREKSAVACLVSSAVPAVFGAAGVAVLLLSQVTGRPLAEVVRSCAGGMVVPAVLAPWLTCVAAGGVRSARRFLGPCLAGGLAYTGATLLGALYISPYIAAILGALVFLGVALALAKGFGKNAAWSWRKFARGWEPFLIMTLCVAVWSLPWVRGVLSRIGEDWPVPALHLRVLMADPFGNGALPALWNAHLAASAGTAILIASFLTSRMAGMTPGRWSRLLVRSLRDLLPVAVNLAAVCSVGFLLVYSGMAGTMAYPFRNLSSGYLVAAPLIGWLGTFLTGSNSASIALFGGLQAFASQVSGLSPAVVAAVFAVAAVGGKMVAPQALLVAVQSSGLPRGSEGRLLRKVLLFSLLLPVMEILYALSFHLIWKL